MKNNKGFSLVELIVVIAIMAILAAVAVASYSIYIERAQDAADKNYLDNIVYFAELFAVENQLPLEGVVVDPEVTKPENIKLIIGYDKYGQPIYYDGDVSEIYNAVGNGYVEGGFNNGKYDPENGGIVIPPDFEGEDPTCMCLHPELVYEQPITCTQAGWKQYRCMDCRRGWTEKTGDAKNHTFVAIETNGTSKYTYSACSDCGKIQITSSDGSIIVPLD